MKFFLKSTVAALVLLAVAPALASEDSNLSLNEAVSKGIVTNPEYAIVANDRRAVDNELRQARALWLPSVDAIADAGYEYTDTETIDSESLFRKRASVTLSQLLFDGFGTPSEINRQKSRVNSASARVGEVAEFVGLDIVEAYLEVLRQRDLLSIASANVADHNSILGTIRDGASAGTITEGDVSQADARYAQARATEVQVREDLRVAEALFVQKTGVMPGVNLSFPEVPRDSVQGDLDAAVRKALTNSPTLAIFESDIDVAKEEYHASGATLYPQVNLEVNGTVGDDVGGLEGSEKRASALAVMRWNLFRGGADVARQEEFLYRHAVSKDRRADAARQVEKDVRDTWASVDSSRERADNFRIQAEANERVVGVYKDQFSLDRRTLLDVLDSQNELFVSRSSHVNALYTEIFGVYRLLALQGELLNHLGIDRPREAYADMPLNQRPARVVAASAPASVSPVLSQTSTAPAAAPMTAPAAAPAATAPAFAAPADDIEIRTE